MSRPKRALHRADHLRIGRQRIGGRGDRIGLLHPGLEAVLAPIFVQAAGAL